MKPTNSPELFIEIGVEEMPAETIPVSLATLLATSAQLMKEAGLSHSPFEVYGTPRRLILYTPQLAEKQETRVETIVGPPKRIAYDVNGDPTPAAIGFAKLHNISPSKLAVVTTEKGEYLSVEKKIVGQSTPALLKNLIPEMIASLRFARSMRWNGPVAFIRPIRWIVALYNLKVVPCSFVDVSSGNRSYGHRLVAPEPFKVTDFASYKKEIQKRFVVIDPSERYQKIKKEIEKIAKEASGIVEEDDHLIWQAAYSTENPSAICGSFDRAFLSIPKEIISTAMKEHQGYFPVNGTTSAMLPYFVAVLNNKDKKKIIQTGCERVLKARLSDARFYFEDDCKGTLADRVPALKGVLFQDKLGTLYDKTQRLVTLAKFIAQKIESLAVLPITGGPATKSSILEEIRRVAPLCKADLVTGIVREFPSLQGVMGRILIDRSSEKENLLINSQAIEEHYQPKGPGDSLPKSLVGQILSVADKLDTIVGCFGIGKIPTGSEDPYALRRVGVGVVQILGMNPLFRPFLLADLIQESVRCFETQKIPFKTNPTLEIAAFLKGRIASHLQSKSVRHDIADAVLTNKTLIPLPPHDLLALAEALSCFSEKPLFNPLITGYKRAARILVTGFNRTVNPTLFTDKAESLLWTAILKAVKDVDVHYEKPDFAAILEALATLYTPLNRFFTDVLVMDANEDIRKNRMALLRVVVNLFDRFGDFSKIGGPTVSDNTAPQRPGLLVGAV